jgi:hypothetical protein
LRFLQELGAPDADSEITGQKTRIRIEIGVGRKFKVARNFAFLLLGIDFGTIFVPLERHWRAYGKQKSRALGQHHSPLCQACTLASDADANVDRAPE